MNRLATTLAAVPVGAVLLLTCAFGGHKTPPAGSGSPSPSASTTKVVDWQTSLSAGVTTPQGPYSVTWPQQLITALPACRDYWVQQDVYRYSTPADKATVDQLIKGKTLTSPSGDQTVVLSWTFIAPVKCQTPQTPVTTPTGESTSPVPPPPAAQTSTPPASSAAVVQVVQPMPALSSAAPSSSAIGEGLALTGTDDLPALIVIGMTAIGVGGALLQRGRAKR